MILVEKTKYYSKQEVAERLHCSIFTINNKIAKSRVNGLNFGRHKYYTEEQIKVIAECRTYAPKPKQETEAAQQ